MGVLSRGVAVSGDRQRRRAFVSPFARQPGAWIFAGGRVPWPLRARAPRSKIPISSATGHRRCRAGRARRRIRSRLLIVHDRLGAVVGAPCAYAPAGVRARSRPSVRLRRGVGGGWPLLVWPRSRAGDPDGRGLGHVFDRHRDRGAGGNASPQQDARTRRLRGFVDAGSDGGAVAVFRHRAGGRQGRPDGRRHLLDFPAGPGRARRADPWRTAVAAAVVSIGGGGAIHRIIHGRLPFGGGRLRRRQRRGGIFDGPWSLHRRPAARRNRVSPRDRDHHRALQGPVARPVLRFDRGRPRYWRGAAGSDPDHAERLWARGAQGAG